MNRDTKKNVNLKENRKKSYARIIYIITIAFMLMSMKALNFFFESKWLAFFMSMMIQSAFLTSCFQSNLKKRSTKIMVIFLRFITFNLSWSILYVSFLQASYLNISVSNSVQKLLNRADSDCCNALKDFTDKQIAKKEESIKNYIKELQKINSEDDKNNWYMHENLNKDSGNEDILDGYIFILAEELNEGRDEEKLQGILNNIYMDMEEKKIVVEDAVFSDYFEFQNNIVQLVQLKKINDEILDMYKNEEIITRKKVDSNEWIDRLHNIESCRKKLGIFGIDNDENCSGAIENLDKQIELYVLSVNEFGECLKLLFHNGYQYKSRLYACAIFALLIHVIEVLAIMILCHDRQEA